MPLALHDRQIRLRARARHAPDIAANALALSANTSCCHCRPDGKPAEWCKYYVCAADGAVSRTVTIDLSRPQMMHDFAITRNYAVFLDAAIVFDPSKLVKGGNIPFVSDKTSPCRIGIVRKPRDVGADALSEFACNNGNADGKLNGLDSEGHNGVRWFEVPPFVCLHTINAWEVDADTVCVAICQCAAACECTLSAVIALANSKQQSKSRLGGSSGYFVI